MTARTSLLLLVAIAFTPVSAQAPLKRSTPELEGVSSAAVLAFVQAADTSIDAMNSFMLMRHGSVIAEGWWGPYDARTQQSCIR